MAFDLVASEYGWSDEYIFDLPLCRFRQVTAAIQRRRHLQERQESGRVSWLARSLGVLIAGGYMLAEGKSNPALDFAQTLAFDDVERALLGSPDNPAPAAPKENGPGSFERFMMMTHQLDQRGKMI